MKDRFKGSYIVGLTFTFVSTVSMVAYAASDGGLGSTSAGTSDVGLIVQELVQVKDLIDLDLDNGDGSNVYVPGGGDVSSVDVFCVYYNNATGVDLTLTSTNGAGAGYTLDDGSANTIPYLVDIDEGNDGSFASHTDGDTVNYPNMADTQVNCGGGVLNAIRVRIVDTGSPLGVPNGTYTDTITYVIAPNP